MSRTLSRAPGVTPQAYSDRAIQQAIMLLEASGEDPDRLEDLRCEKKRRQSKRRNHQTPTFS